MTGHAGGLGPGDGMHDAAGKGDLGQIGQARVVAGAAVHDATDSKGLFPDPRLTAVEAMKRPESFAGMAGCANGANFLILVPMAERLGGVIGMGGAVPIHDRLVVLDLDLFGIEGSGLRQDEDLFGFGFGCRVGLLRIARSGVDHEDRGKCDGDGGGQNPIPAAHGDVLPVDVCSGPFIGSQTC